MTVISTASALLEVPWSWIYSVVCLTALMHVAAWMRSNRLQLNTSKTEVMWCTLSRRQHQLPDTTFTFGEDMLKPFRSLSIATSAYTSTRTCPWGPTYQELCRRVLPRCIRRSVTGSVLKH